MQGIEPGLLDKGLGDGRQPRIVQTVHAGAIDNLGSVRLHDAWLCKSGQRRFVQPHVEMNRNRVPVLTTSCRNGRIDHGDNRQ